MRAKSISLADRLGHLSPGLALGGLLTTLLAGLLVPLYTDETGWRFQERAAIDGGLDSLFSDTCGPNTIAYAPWFMMPVRWFSAETNRVFADPMFIRIEGVACAVAWVGLFLMLTRRLQPDVEKLRALRALTFALLGLGVLPFLMVLSRPEQPIILTAALILLVTFARWPSLSPSLRAWIKSAAILTLSIIAMSYHMKAVLYGLLAGACLIVCEKGRGTVAPRAIGVTTLVILMAASAYYWVERVKCPGDPLLAARYARLNVAALLAAHGDVFAILPQMINGAIPLHYVALATPTPYPMSDWLPHGIFPPWLSIAFFVVIASLWTAAMILSLIALERFVVGAKRDALREPRVVLALTILAVTVIWGASQPIKDVYEAAHIVPLLSIFLVLCLTLPVKWPVSGAAFASVSAGAVTLAILSQAIVLSLLLPPFIAVAQSPGYISNQPYSISIAGYAGIRRDIFAAMSASGIPTDRRLNRLLVDELTYLALQDSRLPLHRLGVLSTWNGEINDPIDYLRSRNSDGVVLGCHLLMPQMRAIASRSGEICAISRQGLDQIAKTDASLRASPP